MNTRDELKEMIVNNAASWRKEENTDDMAEIYVDDFLNELLGKFKLLPIDNVSQRSELLAFAKEMQNIGFNEMDDAEKVVDIYMKANCG